MTCPECKSEYEWKNFCGNCGIALKLKCLKCEEMEEIGLAYCLTERINFINLYINQDKRRLFFLFCSICVLLLACFMGFAELTGLIKSSLMYLTIGLLVISLILSFISGFIIISRSSEASKIFDNKILENKKKKGDRP